MGTGLSEKNFQLCWQGKDDLFTTPYKMFKQPARAWSSYVCFLLAKPVLPLIWQKEEEVAAASNQTILHMVFMADDLNTIKKSEVWRTRSQSMGVYGGLTNTSVQMLPACCDKQTWSTWKRHYGNKLCIHYKTHPRESYFWSHRLSECLKGWKRRKRRARAADTLRLLPKAE